MRLLPRSLTGQTVAILVGGLLAAQVVSIVVNHVDRSGSVYRMSAESVARRIGTLTRALDRLDPDARPTVVSEFDSRSLRVRLAHQHVGLDLQRVDRKYDEYEASFADLLRQYLRRDFRSEVAIVDKPPNVEVGAAVPANQDWFDRLVYRSIESLVPSPHAIVVQVRLSDDTAVSYVAALPHESPASLRILLYRLLITICAAAILTLVAIRIVTRSLRRLGHAAETLSVDLNQPPLAEEGPTEIRRTISAFNAMQERLRAYVLERTRILAAMSHDLRTPLTRMRLRAELITDAAERARMIADVQEMQSMVDASLDYAKAMHVPPERTPLDVNVLLESIQADWEDLGHDIAIAGRTSAPLSADARLLRRCIGNLVANAVRYGQRARIVVEDRCDALTIRVVDDGPGIPAAEIERVFEPFYRLDGSRNRAHGGTGLGLTIARNIARMHGGTLTLRNHAPASGLEAIVCLPRAAMAPPISVREPATAG
jgi:signal transduction histidine kinase